MCRRILHVVAIGIMIIFLICCGKKKKIKEKIPISDKSGEKERVEVVSKSTLNEAESGFERDIEEEETVFRLRNSDEKENRPKVQIDKSNIAIKEINTDFEETEASAKMAFSKDTPPESLAGSLPKLRKKILWTPKWRYHGLGEVWLPETTLCSDSSIMAVIETTGLESGPNGGRIILINIYNWEILRIHEFPEQKLSQICFIPGRNMLALWSEKQVALEKPYEVLIIDYITGKILSSSNAIKSAVSDMISDGDSLFIKPAGENCENIFVFDVLDLSKQSIKISSGNSEGRFAISPDNSRLVLGGNKFIEIFDVSTKNIIRKIPLDTNFITGAVTFAGRNNWIAVSSYRGPAILFKDGKGEKICENSGRILGYNEEKKLFLVEQYGNNQISLYSLPDLKETTAIDPAKSKPRTKGSALFVTYLNHHEKYMILDSHGNLGLYYKPRGKWKKDLIFSAKK